MPPPIPRLPPRGDEPKPLFAATMASLEKSAATSERANLPSLAKGPGLAGMPMTAKANGTGASALLSSLRGTAPNPAMPAQSASAAALAAAFKQDEPAEPMTAVEAPAFGEDPGSAAEPAATAQDDDDEDNLEIGEVSRVVKLADLAAMGRSKRTSSNPALRAPAQANPALRPSAPNLQARGLTGSHARLSPSELGMNVDPALAALAPVGQPTADESMLAHSFAKRHRRGMIVLLTVSAAMLLGVIVTVIFLVSGRQDELPMGLGGTRVIDTSRPEDIVRNQLLPAPPDDKPGEVTQHKPAQRPVQRPTITTTQPEEPETGPGSSLGAGEIEAMAAKYGEGTKRCYMRAQKGVLGLEIADTRKIEVTLTVAKDGTVTDVKLSKHAGNDFGKCLIARIKAWHFRDSRGGTFRISLAFSAS